MYPIVFQYTWTAKPLKVMLHQQVLSEKIFITQKGTIRHFQLRVPRSAEKLIGMECGVRMNSVLPVLQQPAGFTQSLQFFPTRIMGELTLQNVGKGNLFYSVPVIEQDAHVSYGDYSNQAAFAPKCYTHCAKREPVEINIPRDTAIIMGMYKDLLGTELNDNLQYWILIHLWFETKEDEQ